MNRLNTTWLYVKMGALALVVLYVICFVVINSLRKADVWLFFFYDLQQVRVLWVILVTAVITLVTEWFSRQLYRTWRQLQDVRRERAAESRARAGGTPGGPSSGSTGTR
jgi:hypothetical protein